MTVDMSDFDKAIERYEKALEIAKKMLEDGFSVEKIAKITDLPEYEIRNLK